MAKTAALPSAQRAILDCWADVISETPSGSTFSVAAHDKRDPLQERTEAFLEEPTPERFTDMWRRGYAAGRAVAPTPIPEKWADKGGTIQELAALIREITTSDIYDPDWEEALSAPRSTREFYGWHHPDTTPILNAYLINALEFFAIPDEPVEEKSFEEQREAFEQFQAIYESQVGHATAGTDWEVPLNVEIYLLCVCIDTAEGSIDDEQHDGFQRLYDAILAATETTTGDVVTASAEDYWADIELRQQRADAFLSDPSRDRFEAWLEPFPWFVSRWADSKADRVFEEYTPEDVVTTLEEAVGAGPAGLESVLSLPGFGVTAATEALASLAPGEFVPLNKRVTESLEALGYEPPSPNTSSAQNYETLLDLVDTVLERADVTAAVEGAPDWATPYQIVTYLFYKHKSGDIDITAVLPGAVVHDPDADQASDTDDATVQPTPDTSAAVGDIDFYWVNQTHDRELTGEYLRSQDQQWQRDLTVLDEGDVVFHYSNQSIRACSVVTEEAYRTEMDGGEYYRVDLTTTQLSTPVSLETLRESLQNPELKQEKERYPLDKNGNVIQAYLCHLTPEAGQYLLDTTGVSLPLSVESSTNYFWVTANPSIWSVDEIDDGGEVTYTAYNDQGNKKRLFEAFTTASPGDRVLFYESQPTSAIVAEGTVTEGFTPASGEEEAASTDSEAGITIQFDRRLDPIEWSELTTIQDLEEATPIRDGGRGSLFPLTESEFDTILALETPIREGVSQEAIDRLRTRLDAPPVEIDMPPGLYFEDGDRLQREIEATLQSGKHLILTGPPGTGKTKLAKAICRQATAYDAVDDFRFTTATSEWTAFDTIGGYVPSTGDGGQELLFEPRLFLKCFRQDRIVNEWLIIDEINRSDIDKAFGQLFSVLSGDSTELPYERERTVELLSLSDHVTEERLADVVGNPDAFPVTPSWRLLATMNTYDKTSLYEMSYAFMRRFNFVHVGVPDLVGANGVRTSLLDPDGTDNYATAWLDEEPAIRPLLEAVYPEVAVLWQRINEHRVIGPSIVYDIIRYLAAYDSPVGDYREALTSAVVSLVYPQLEGMRPDQQKRLIGSLGGAEADTEAGSVKLALDEALLEAKAADFFGINFEDES